MADPELGTPVFLAVKAGGALVWQESGWLPQPYHRMADLPGLVGFIDRLCPRGVSPAGGIQLREPWCGQCNSPSSV